MKSFNRVLVFLTFSVILGCAESESQRSTKANSDTAGQAQSTDSYGVAPGSVAIDGVVNPRLLPGQTCVSNEAQPSAANLGMAESLRADYKKVADDYCKVIAKIGRCQGDLVLNTGYGSLKYVCQKAMAPVDSIPETGNGVWRGKTPLDDASTGGGGPN